METRPPEKRFWMVPFTIHATRGLLRDQKSRRKTMTLCLVVAVALSIAGFTGFGSWLDPHEHPVRFLFFWGACGWITVTALLLALIDMLMLRVQARRAREELLERANKGNHSGE
jgi:uncharacterized membrane protein YedE/YeeE